jgi:hypothetical protein
MTTIISEAVNPGDITISWPALTDETLTGGDPISFYSVEWLNEDANLWQEINSGTALATSFKHIAASPPFPGGSI